MIYVGNHTLAWNIFIMNRILQVDKYNLVEPFKRERRVFIRGRRLFAITAENSLAESKELIPRSPNFDERVSAMLASLCFFNALAISDNKFQGGGNTRLKNSQIAPSLSDLLKLIKSPQSIRRPLVRLLSNAIRK